MKAAGGTLCSVEVHIKRNCGFLHFKGDNGFKTEEPGFLQASVLQLSIMLDASIPFLHNNGHLPTQVPEPIETLIV